LPPVNAAKNWILRAFSSVARGSFAMATPPAKPAGEVESTRTRSVRLPCPCSYTARNAPAIWPPSSVRKKPGSSSRFFVVVGRRVPVTCVRAGVGPGGGGGGAVGEGGGGGV
jgi:hypothetical protein